MNSTGWALLQLETRDTFSDVVQVDMDRDVGRSCCWCRAAGYLEGWVTRELLHMQYLNTIVGRCSTVH